MIANDLISLRVGVRPVCLIPSSAPASVPAPLLAAPEQAMLAALTASILS